MFSNILKKFEFLKGFFKNILTGKDNQTYDIARIGWFFGLIFYCIMTFISSYHNGYQFPYKDWAIGFGAIMAASGASVKFKESSEPQGFNIGNGNGN